MPIEIDNPGRTRDTQIIFSKVAELIAALHFLGDKQHHASDPSWVAAVLDSLSKQGLQTLGLISELNFPAGEFFDFLPKTGIFQDVDRFLAKIARTPDLDFLFTFFNEEVTKEQISRLQKNKGPLDTFKQTLREHNSGSDKALGKVLFDTRNYKKDLVGLIKELNGPLFEAKMAGLRDTYQESMDAIRRRLANKHPLDLIYEVKGCLYERRDYQKYVFCPSYFLYHNVSCAANRLLVFVYNVHAFLVPVDSGAKKQAVLLKVLADKNRLEILRQLAVEPTYGKILASRLCLSTATVSRHLDQLRSIGLVREVKKNNIKYFELQKEGMESLLLELGKFLKLN